MVSVRPTCTHVLFLQVATIITSIFKGFTWTYWLNLNDVTQWGKKDHIQQNFTHRCRQQGLKSALEQSELPHMLDLSAKKSKTAEKSIEKTKEREFYWASSVAMCKKMAGFIHICTHTYMQTHTYMHTHTLACTHSGGEWEREHLPTYKRNYCHLKRNLVYHAGAPKAPQVSFNMSKAPPSPTNSPCGHSSGHSKKHQNKTHPRGKSSQPVLHMNHPGD